MRRSKRVKTSHSTEQDAPLPKPPTPSHAEHDSLEVAKAEDAVTTTDSKTIPVSTATLSSDPALLDEEENPYESEMEPANKPGISHHANGGATYTSGHGFNTLKSFNGQVYSGMAVGGSHTWNYDQGVWKETKEEPDLWKIDYATTKRRARNAPRGSGAPVGTEYHWLIVAHQVRCSSG